MLQSAYLHTSRFFIRRKFMATTKCQTTWTHLSLLAKQIVMEHVLPTHRCVGELGIRYGGAVLAGQWPLLPLSAPMFRMARPRQLAPGSTIIVTLPSIAYAARHTILFRLVSCFTVFYCSPCYCLLPISVCQRLLFGAKLALIVLLRDKWKATWP